MEREAVLALALIGASVISRNRLRKRKEWQRKWLQRRHELGCYENLIRELAFEDSEGYRRYLRMDVDTFEQLVTLISPLIEKKNTAMRKAIPAAERIAVTLRFLATGETQSSLSYQFRIAQNTISGIIPSVCSAIIQCLPIKVPDTEEEWKCIAADFWEMWNFPLCLGALDGKHVKILQPPNSGAVFRNYKGFFSIVLMGLVDANLKFLFVDIGTNGRISDGGVWGKTKLKNAIEQKLLNIPEAQLLPGSTVDHVPYVIVADDAFPLKPYMMKPYQGRNLSANQRIHNYRLSRARRVSENAFGILAARFRIFGIPIASSIANCKLIVMAACCLHNFLIEKSLSFYLPPGSVDEDLGGGSMKDGSWRNNPNVLQSCRKILSRGSEEAKAIRQKYCKFFNNEGAVSWQNEYYALH